MSRPILNNEEISSMGMILSENAANEVKRIITVQNLPEGTVLRVGVRDGGCSGLSYSLDFDTNTTERDHIVDFYDGLEKRGFVFNNPNVAQTCCCGSSFQV